eukprot:1758118-Amphidinium_carterae.1
MDCLGGCGVVRGLEDDASLRYQCRLSLTDSILRTASRPWTRVLPRQQRLARKSTTSSRSHLKISLGAARSASDTTDDHF